MTRLTDLVLPSPPSAWKALGFAVSDDVVDVGGVRIAVGGDAPAGMTAWGFAGHVAGDVDGLPLVAPTAPTGTPPVHPNGIDAVDHVVVGTGDVERTLTALMRLGLRSSRQRVGPLRGEVVHQEFLVAGTCVIELIGPPEPDGGPASFWGLAFAAPDLDATARVLGARLRDVRAAIQPGRRIATVRGGRTAVGVPLAVLSARGA